MQALTPLREEIDQIDKQLLALVAKRLELVSQVGAVKQRQGLPVYAPQREAKMLQARRQEAEAMGVPGELIEDILRRLMRQSYAGENRHGFKTVNPQIQKIVIVGGRGKLGGLFGQYLQASGYAVQPLERDDWPQAPQILQGADAVLVCVPIVYTSAVIERLQPFLTENMLLADLTSIKRTPLAKMLAVHTGAVLGLHPMFGPDIGSMAKQVIVQCDGRFPERYQWLLDQMRIWGAKLYPTTAAEHDKNMTYIQAVRHFATFANGLHLSKQPVNLPELLALSSPIYRLELAMIGRLFAQNAELYADIIADKPENLQVIGDLLQSYQDALALFQQKDKAEFVRQFHDIQVWFGDYADQFLQESRRLLQQAQDLS